MACDLCIKEQQGEVVSYDLNEYVCPSCGAHWIKKNGKWEEQPTKKESHFS